MSLKIKISIMLGFVVLLYIAMDYVIQRYTLLPGFESLQEEEAHRNLRGCQATLENECETLAILTCDWSYWDDTYEYAQAPTDDHEYLESNIVTSTFTHDELNVIAYFDRNEEPIHLSFFDLETDQFRQMPDSFWDELASLCPDYLGDDAEDYDHESRAGKGILITDFGLLAVAYAPILNNELQGPAEGTMMMARLLSDKISKRMQEQTQLYFHVNQLDMSQLPQEIREGLQHLDQDQMVAVFLPQTNTVRDFTIIHDIKGNPSLLLQAEIPCKIIEQGKIAMKYAHLSTIAGCVVILGALALLLQNTVVAPLSRLQAHVLQLGKSDDLSHHLNCHRDDEVGALAQEFNNMIDRLRQSRQQLMEQSYYTGMSEIASGALHNIRNALAPLSSQVQLLTEEVQGACLQEIKQAHEELQLHEVTPQRHDDLEDFLSAAYMNLFDTMQRIQIRLEDIAEPIGQLEQVLATQETFRSSSLNIEWIEPIALVQDALKLVSPKMLDSIQLVVDPGLNQYPAINTHRITMIQILANLITNAIEATPWKSRAFKPIEITGGIETIDNQDVFHFQVIDQGKGIESRDIEQVFQRGYTTKTQGGSGIGLHWCSNAVIALSGKIYAESEGAGHGARLHVIFPIRIPETVTQAEV